MQTSTKKRQTKSSYLESRWAVWIEKLVHDIHRGVSKNNGTPKSSILIGFYIINHPFWGTPIFGNIHRELFCSDFHVLREALSGGDSSQVREQLYVPWRDGAPMEVFHLASNNKLLSSICNRNFTLPLSSRGG